LCRPQAAACGLLNSILSKGPAHVRRTAELREENLAACAAEVLLKLNMTTRKAAIYCTLVAGDTNMDSLR
jgi:hypothetical protein